jgi:hypothetical protein
MGLDEEDGGDFNPGAILPDDLKIVAHGWIKHNE